MQLVRSVGDIQEGDLVEVVLSGVQLAPPQCWAWSQVTGTIDPGRKLGWGGGIKEGVFT